MKKTILAVMVAFCATAMLSGIDISVPSEISAFKDLEIGLGLRPGEGIQDARFYFIQQGTGELLYSSFKEKEGKWVAVVPFQYLKGEELVYYTQVRTDKGKLMRYPSSGRFKARLLQDVTPPAIRLKSPEKPVLEKGKEQLVVFDIIDESGIAEFSILYNNQPLKKAAVYKGTLSFLVSPPVDKNPRALISVSMTDYFGNKAKQDFTFTLVNPKLPPFMAKGGYTAKASVEYTIDAGESANSTVLETIIGDLHHDVVLNYELGGWTKLKAGPVGFDAGLTLADEISIFAQEDGDPVYDILEAYPNGLLADFQSILNLWNPIDFANEFDYSNNVARKFYNDNTLQARLSFFDPVLAYTFGDQKISFQKETINEFSFRGHSLFFEPPILNVAVAKGLSDLGLESTAWPQTFLALQAGLDFWDYFWLKVNLGLISSLQGQYEYLKTNDSIVETLYDLGSVKPEENLVFGINTGSINNLFTLTAGLALSLYVDDAGSIIDLDVLADNLKDPTVLNVDISPYLEYVNLAQKYTHVLDYFPPSNGILGKAVSRDLWGISYGADLKITKLGLDAWFHKTDAAYKSLAASVDTDVMNIGGQWGMNFGGFDLGLKYTWEKDNIPDILFNDFLPLAGIASDPSWTANDISNLTHEGLVSITTPPAGILGSLKFTYNLEHISTNAQALADAVDSSTTKTQILTSTANDWTFTNTVGLQWKSGRIKLGKLVASFGAKTEDAYVMYLKVDGADSTDSLIQLGYGVDGALQAGIFRLNLGFEQKFNDDAEGDVNYGYDVKIGLSKVLFDRISLSGAFDQLYNDSVLQEQEIAAKASFEKAFGPLTTGLTMSFDWVDSMTTPADDAITASVTLSGAITL